jgi:hypothetical protein
LGKKAKRKVPSFKKDKFGKKRKVRKASSGNFWQRGVEKTGCWGERGEHKRQGQAEWRRPTSGKKAVRRPSTSKYEQS